MAKELKKKGRRLKRTVRKTLGTICLISAILIGTIPTEGLKQVAAEGSLSKLPAAEIEKIAVASGSKIPNLKDSVYSNLKIYNSGNGFQFAFVSESGSAAGSSATDKIAVLVGFDYNTADGTNTLEGNTLIIPETLDAYLNYTLTDGSYGSYVAVSQDERFLFYEASPAVPAVPEVKDPSTGDVVTPAVPEVPAVYQPCYSTDFSKWGDIPDDELYFYLTPDSKPGTEDKPGYNVPIQVKMASSHNVNVNDKMRIKNAPVRYIGNHYSQQKANGEFEIAGETDQDHRIFGNIGNITALQVKAKLFGIGNYAFYECTNLTSITLNDDLFYIGNHAFAGCRNMNSVHLNANARVAVIGERAFENCQALASFNVPLTVKAIGDAAFKGCAGPSTGLQTINMVGGADSNPNLQQLGCDLFVDCNKLTSVTFPGSLTEDVDISNFEGCTSLQYIAVSSRTTNITEGLNSDFGYKEFQEQYKGSDIVQGTFYFEGPTQQSNPSDLHQTAMDNEFAFSYLNSTTLKKEGIYELTTRDESNKAMTYRVSGPEYPDGANRLISHKLDAGIEKLELPKYIGPQTIATVASGVFQDYCSMNELVIPSTVKKIERDAFSGCHHLKYVLFDEPSGLVIDEGAFQTQKIDAMNPGSTHGTGCAGEIEATKEPELMFIGPASSTSGPFQYAMNPNNNINYGTQERTYITFFSGWPDGLVVRYNKDTEKTELLDYLCLSDLENPSSSLMHEVYAELDSEKDTEYTAAMTGAYSKKGSSGTPMTQYEEEVWGSFMNIVLPDGVESIKPGLFKENEIDTKTDTVIPVDGKYKTLQAYGLKEVTGAARDEEGNITDEEAGCFANCTTFDTITLYDGTESIGDYAFKGCTNLVNVTLPNTVTQMGLIPFTGCEKLTHVNFQSSPYYSCEDSIIYKLDTAGNKYELVEYLEGRTGGVNATAVAGLKSIAPEAFKGTGVTNVDLSETFVTTIPERAFADCRKLRTVVLPDTIYTLESQAFTGCPTMMYIEIPATNMRIEGDAFDVAGENRPDDLEFACSEGSEPYKYAVTNGFAIAKLLPKFKVTFEDWDGKVLKEQIVELGGDATPPSDPTREGYIFQGWNKDYTGIGADITITAMYKEIGAHDNDVTVTFYDDDFTTVLYTREVTPGNKVDLPPDPKKEGYMFIGWEGSDSNGSVSVDDPITEKTNFKAVYEELDGKIPIRFIDSFDNSVINAYTVNPGDAPIVPGLPTREGVTYTRWFPDIPETITEAQDFIALYVEGGGSDVSGGNKPGVGDDDPNGGGGDDGPRGGDDEPATSKLYTLTVQNGSGSGSYVAGSQPIVIANDPANGYEFSHWTIDPSGTKIASTVLSATVITMPEGNVTVTAHYKAKTGSSSGGGSVSGNNSNRPNSGSNVLSNGTTVVIDKNGLSNTGVVSATVKGSSDNFTIKVTESSAASEAVVKALKAEYGDISNIKYFPMDISLYDASGTRKITDTTGLSISITLPLPDSLITYAGNNQVAGVVNDRLDKLSPKFTTIDKVACVTFTAEHFSPYVIYVETDNLSKGTVVDSTPKTGDGIHPKWFLSIGLACVAMVLFMKKDKRTLQKARVA